MFLQSPAIILSNDSQFVAVDGEGVKCYQFFFVRGRKFGFDFLFWWRFLRLASLLRLQFGGAID